MFKYLLFSSQSVSYSGIQARLHLSLWRIKRKHFSQIMNRKRAVLKNTACNIGHWIITGVLSVRCNNVIYITNLHIVSFPVAIKSCPVTLDLAFVLDASNQVSRRNFQLEKAFVKTVASKFTITKHQSHIGLITYANLPSLRMRFRQYNSLFGMTICWYIEYVYMKRSSQLRIEMFIDISRVYRL